MSQKGRRLRWKTKKLSALCLIVGCLVFDRAGACIAPSAGTGILFDHIPDGLYEPIIAEVTIVSREADISLPNHGQQAVMTARVERVIRGTLDSDVLKIVTPLYDCSIVGVGHGFVAGMLEHDAQRGLELFAKQRPIAELVRGR